MPEVEYKVNKAGAAQAQAEGDEGASAALVAAHVSVAYKKVTGEATTKSKRLVPPDASQLPLRLDLSVLRSGAVHLAGLRMRQKQ